MTDIRDNTRSLQDTLIIRKLLQEAIDYSNVAVYGAITERRDYITFANVRGALEDTLIKLDESAKLQFGDAYKPEPFRYGGLDRETELTPDHVNNPKRYMAAKAPIEKNHTVRGGKPAAEFGDYGVTHDMDCPGCQDTSFLASPRSETYWQS
jgi:hypothetical protein